MLVRRLNIFIFAGLALAGTGIGAAQAADYTPPPPVYVQPPPPPEFAGGWYLRGDIGFSNQSVGSLNNDNYNRYASVTNVYKSFDAAPLFGLGVGYTVNNWLRVDATGEYRANANFKGEDIGCTGGAPPCEPDVYTGSKSEWTFLLNGYVDLGTWDNFTPFVGAGVGFSRNTISSFTDTNVVRNGVSTADTHSKWSFAWALMAGVGYRVTDNLTLELSYRYIDLGDAETGSMTGFCCGSYDTPYQFRHLTSQDVRLGLRYNFDALAVAPPPQYYVAPPVYAPPPVYTPAPVYAPPLRSRG